MQFKLVILGFMFLLYIMPYQSTITSMQEFLMTIPVFYEVIVMKIDLAKANG